MKARVISPLLCAGILALGTTLALAQAGGGSRWRRYWWWERIRRRQHRCGRYRWPQSEPGLDAQPDAWRHRQHLAEWAAHGQRTELRAADESAADPIGVAREVSSSVFLWA